MDLTTIANRTGIPPRLLRYVVYHELMPTVDSTGGGKGLTRNFGPAEAFGIAVAAMLLTAGLKGGPVREVMAALVRKQPRGFLRLPLLIRAMQATGAVQLQVADGLYVRVRTVHEPTKPASDSGWVVLAGGEPPAGNYDPTVVVVLNPTLARRVLTEPT